MSFLGPLIAGATSLIGGFLGKSSQDKANEIALQNAQRQEAFQKEFAQNAIQWKAADARAAGLHPLAALGANTVSYSPVSVGVSGSNPLGDAIGSMGQNLERAVHATSTSSQRAEAAKEQITALSLERGHLENDLLRAQIASTNAKTAASQSGPPGPSVADPYLIPGSVNSGLVTGTPLKTVRGAGDQPSSEGGAVTDVGYARTQQGWYPVPSKDVKERVEDNFLPELMWAIRNNVLPMFKMNMNPPKGVLKKKGHEWQFHPMYGYRQVPRYVPYVGRR